MLKNKYFSSSSLKLFAIIFMLIDHTAVSKILYINSETYTLMRIFGRLALPIFAFLIIEGYFYTKNVHKYLMRLGLFAIISEMPFDLFLFNQYLEGSHQNIFFTLFLGLLSVYFYEKYKSRNSSLSILFVIFIAILAEIIKTDYGIYGIIIIFLFYLNRGNFLKLLISIFILNLLYSIPFGEFIMTQSFSIAALGLIYFYNNKKGYNLKYLFYLFYPIHLLILYLIKYFIL